MQYVKTTSPKSRRERPDPGPARHAAGREQAPIAARATGYLKRWTKDIGASVEKGELLAEIESPEIDQQLSQAIAARQQTAASLALAKSTTERWEALRKTRRGLAAGARREAQRRRPGATPISPPPMPTSSGCARLQGFTRVTAPFAGVITRRAVDTGDLIDSGGGKTGVFVLTQMDPLRVYVNVPQSYAQLVRPGQKVVVTQAELRGKTFTGEVVRTAGSIDTATRTMQVEIEARQPRRRSSCPAPSSRWRCRSRPSPGLVVPTNVLLFRSEGTRVAVVDAASKVRAAGGDPGPQSRRGDRDRRRHRRRATGWWSIRRIRSPRATRWRYAAADDAAAAGTAGSGAAGRREGPP